MPSVLVVVGGLPGTGKTTIATALARRTTTPYLRVDRIEQAIVEWSALTHPLGAVGYAVASQLATEQLALGLSVIVECVNPVAASRDNWVATAAAARAHLIEVELVCSDPTEHRRRVEQRSPDVAGLVKPTWRQVAEREYEPWRRPHLVIDSARSSVAAAVERIAAEMAAMSSRNSREPTPGRLVL